MKLNVNFTGIEKALNSIGGKKASVGSLREAKAFSSPLEIALNRDGELVISRAEDLANLSYPAGLIALGSTQVSLHIFHPWEDKESLSKTPAGKTRFHIAECRKLEQMKKGQRFDRYVASKRTDNLFSVTPYDSLTRKRGEKMDAQLSPCRVCLETINYQDYRFADRSERRKIVEKFSLDQFFQENKHIFRLLPLYTAETMPSGEYSQGWANVSKKYRALKDWSCECCGVNLSLNQGLLHAHHKDGVRGNEKYSNLRALCVLCHKAQPLHGHMQIKAEEVNKIRVLRTEQNLSLACNSCS